MNVSIQAFEDELIKIAETRKPVTKDNAIRGFKGALLGGAASGIGTGLGGLVARKFVPGVPAKLTNNQLKAMSMVASGLGAGAGMLKGLGMMEYRRYVDKDVKRG